MSQAVGVMTDVPSAAAYVKRLDQPMTRTAVRPTGVERTFGEDELIVSKTDPKGIIRYANAVFCRLSAYEEADLIGRPHNIIRHPDMPSIVFKLLWDTVASGRELFAYVVNLASDGAHYWVLAHVTPSFGDRGQIVGYHSNRRVPARSALETIVPLYERLRAAERQAGEGKQATESSGALLRQFLDERNCDYERFVWSITPSGAPR